jgi:glycosyltransferase involved in cell wall biosynthesis
MKGLPTIIIPYFKLRYLEATLASLAAQTVGGFKVFIGDDASPEDCLPLLEKYNDRLDIHYHRFAENLGGTSLTRHWDRCVERTDSEWIWLFSDDDVAGPECMGSFLQTLKETEGKFDVYRFNVRVIDGDGKTIHNQAPNPREEKTAEFVLAKLLANRFSFAVEYVFRREAYKTAGGFVDFPVAWHSDDASWVAFARNRTIRTMDVGEVLWRKSSLNLSSPKPEMVRAKLGAFRLYLNWLQDYFPEPEFQARLKSGISKLFPNQIQHWGGNPGKMYGLHFWYFFSRYTGTPNLLLLRTLMGLDGLRHRLKLSLF